MGELSSDIPGLGVELLHEGQAAVFTLVGQMDRTHFDRANELLQRTVERGCKYLVGDCSLTTHISSTGIGFLCYYSQRVRKQGGELIVVKPPEDAVRIMDLSNLSGMVRLFNERGQALDYVSSVLG